ncbi:GTP cyclohydrolase II [Hanseniaspora valbyensis NRRL Y-1626]|uniref:GTP cyclohydrolase II n=1 Tax=Hanseniaspora valbyensis NRRL Y-1626 TaxID=766949 RepID=A0A1B7TD81_9ASCO|nr:GTP cyclohydrolase II [Hanseniaspora valbyensis NRRL Y-1626]
MTNNSNELPIVECIARARIPTTRDPNHSTYPEIFLHLYKNNRDNKEHLAITQYERLIRGAYIGKLTPEREIADSYNGITLQFDPKTGDLISNFGEDTFHGRLPVRIHSECFTGETAWSARCDCGEQFDLAGDYILQSDVKSKMCQQHGVIVYLRQEGRGIGLSEKLKAYNLQDLGKDTVEANLLLNHPADGRDFSIASSILMDLQLSEVDLLTNNPDKLKAIEIEGKLRCTSRIPMVPLSWNEEGANGNNNNNNTTNSNSHSGIRSKEVESYLRTKIEKMGHLLTTPLTMHGSNLSSTKKE